MVTIYVMINDLHIYICPHRYLHIYTHDGSMVLLYMVCHGSHQYSPNVGIYTSTMDPMGYGLLQYVNIMRNIMRNIIANIHIHSIYYMFTMVYLR